MSQGLADLRKARRCHGATSQTQRSPSFLPPPAHPRANAATQLSADLRGQAKCQKFPQNTEGGGFGFPLWLTRKHRVNKTPAKCPAHHPGLKCAATSAQGLREGKWEEGANRQAQLLGGGSLRWRRHARKFVSFCEGPVATDVTIH